jgi:hypothetical protein
MYNDSAVLWRTKQIDSYFQINFFANNFFIFGDILLLLKFLIFWQLFCQLLESFLFSFVLYLEPKVDF